MRRASEQSSTDIRVGNVTIRHLKSNFVMTPAAQSSRLITFTSYCALPRGYDMAAVHGVTHGASSPPLSPPSETSNQDDYMPLQPAPPALSMAYRPAAPRIVPVDSFMCQPPYAATSTVVAMSVPAGQPPKAQRQHGYSAGATAAAPDAKVHVRAHDSYSSAGAAISFAPMATLAIAKTKPLAAQVTKAGKKRPASSRPCIDGARCCSQCRTQTTPVWRAGPEGPKTLCNACGVRYMKIARKK